MEENFPIFYPAGRRSSETESEVFNRSVSLSPSIRTTSKKIVLRTRRQSNTFVTIVFLIGVLIGLSSGVLFGLFN